MSIIKIFLGTIIRILCCIIGMFGVLFEGLTKIFENLSNKLNKLDNKVDTMFEKKKKVEKKTVDIPV